MNRFEKTLRETLDSIYRADDELQAAVASQPIDTERCRMALIQLGQVIELARYVTGSYPLKEPIGLLSTRLSA